jgi:opacity protein-like surface antigen
MHCVRVIGGAWLPAVVVACLALPTPTMAAEPTAQAGGTGANDGGRAGRQAMEFAVTSSFTLSAFQGMLISYQRFLTDRRSLRLAAGLSLDVDNRSLDVEYEDIGAEESADLKGWDHSGTVKAQMLFYTGNGPVLFYYGGGPKISYSDFHSESLIYGVGGDELQYRYYGEDDSSWLLGIQCAAGVQWTINERFALHAEYGLTARYQMTETETSYFRSDNPDLDEQTHTRLRSPGLTSDGVLFGLSVYF